MLVGIVGTRYSGTNHVLDYFVSKQFIVLRLEGDEDITAMADDPADGRVPPASQSGQNKACTFTSPDKMLDTGDVFDTAILSTDQRGITDHDAMGKVLYNLGN
ncbi:hypothetical protein FRB99_005187 [Tulasnella sp. 403]|nr:hypothetical protein FRB99_005187 [Tulasnella sp. 403]